MARECDAVVVGGGIVGASSAYHLARAGLETVLVDRDDEGRATDAGAGIVSPATSSRTAADAWFDLAVEAADYYPTLAEELERVVDGPVGFDRPGLLAVAVSADEIDPYESAIGRIRDREERLGVPAPGSVEEIGSAAARERFPPLEATDRAFHYAHAGRVDGRVFTEALLEAGRERGLRVERTDATDVRVEDGRAVGVRTAGGSILEADRVVIAGGAWSAAFADRLGVALPLEPRRGQIAHLEVPDARTGEWPIVKGFRGHYLVPWPGGRVAVGATRETGSGFDPRATAAGVREVLDEALRVAPGLADATLADVRVGLRPATPDGLPVLGRVPGADGILLATGHGPTGLTLGPYSGKVVADLARGASIDVDLERFSVSRFA